MEQDNTTMKTQTVKTTMRISLKLSGKNPISVNVRHEGIREQITQIIVNGLESGKISL